MFHIGLDYEINEFKPAKVQDSHGFVIGPRERRYPRARCFDTLEEAADARRMMILRRRLTLRQTIKECHDELREVNKLC
jgi:signal recognition particle subunit SEC65